jgi:hypothetical protein
MQVAALDLAEICSEFRAGGTKEPEVVWNPAPNQIAVPKLRSVLEYWTSLRIGQALPQATDISPIGLRTALGYVMLVDPVDQGRDFRFRLYGTVLASISGFDMSSKLLSEHGASTYVVEFSLAVYRAAFFRGEPIFTSRTPAAAVHTKEWQRVILPLVDKAGQRSSFLAGKVPIGRNGEPLFASL